jgi:hypothetical protein
VAPGARWREKKCNNLAGESPNRNYVSLVLAETHPAK